MESEESTDDKSVKLNLLWEDMGWAWEARSPASTHFSFFLPFCYGAVVVAKQLENGAGARGVVMVVEGGLVQKVGSMISGFG